MTLSVVKITLLPSVPFEHRQTLPAISAVYFVLSAQREIVYIGECGNLYARWVGKHHQRAPQMLRGGYRIHWQHLPDDVSIRRTVERQAINYFQPLWNRTEVVVDELKEITRYIHNVARHIGMDPQELHTQILKDWAYSRSFGKEV